MCGGTQAKCTAVDLAKANFHIDVVAALHSEVKRVCGPSPVLSPGTEGSRQYDGSVPQCQRPLPS
jgi:hypothetical protein